MQKFMMTKEFWLLRKATFRAFLASILLPPSVVLLWPRAAGGRELLEHPFSASSRVGLRNDGGRGEGEGTGKRGRRVEGEEGKRG